MRALVSEALSETLATGRTGQKPWMKSFGALRSLHKESARIDRLVEREFDRIEPEDRR